MQKNSKPNTQIALKKAKTLIEKILKMVEEDKYCIDVLQQILAVQGLLKSSSEKILSEHLETCFVEGIKTGDLTKQEDLIEELMSVMKLSKKS